MRTYDAIIQHVPGKSAPDSYDPDCGRPPQDFVVSRDIKGEPLSRYGDLIWDRTPYSSGMQTHLHFQYWIEGDLTPLRTSIIEEIHWIMFIIIWRHPARRASATRTLTNNLMALRALARRVEANGITIREAVQDRSFMIATPKSQCPAIFKILGILKFLEPKESGFDIAPGILPFLSDAAIEYHGAKKQTAPIPTRIYSTILSNISSEVEKLRPIVSMLIAMYAAIRSKPGVGLTRLTQERYIGTREATFDELLVRFDLDDFWHNTSATASVSGFSAFLSDAQILLSLQIQAYTGMRSEEVQFLPFDCLEESRRDRDSRIHYIVSGTTTKLNSGKEKRAQWITVKVAADAILIAQHLARAIYAAEGIEPNQMNSRKAGSFLFPPINCDGKFRDFHIEGMKPVRLKISERVRPLLSPLIQEDDQQELYTVDPHRPWSTEDQFAVGARWRLRTHQLRRSLALYAQGSGLVSLPTLKRQLQHITVEMSLYYAKGSAFAQNFVGEKRKQETPHFCDEWQEAQPVSQFLAYAASILLSDESDMFGGHGQWLNTRKRDEKGQILLNRSETLKSFQKGEMAYRPTPLGGCINPVACENTPINVLSVECISTDCKNLIASAKKVERIIFIKTNTIRKLKEADSTSPEVRIEEAELRALQSSLARAKKLK